MTDDEGKEPLTDCPAEEALSAFADGQLDDPEIVAHLEHCASCKSVLPKYPCKKTATSQTQASDRECSAAPLAALFLLLPGLSWSISGLSREHANILRSGILSSITLQHQRPVTEKFN